MQRMIIFLSLFLLACMAASATTNITTCGTTITAAGNYTIPSRLTHTGSSDCVTIDVSSLGASDIVHMDCASTSGITDTAITPSGHLLNIIDTTTRSTTFPTVQVLWCDFNTPNATSWYRAVNVSKVYATFQYNTFERNNLGAENAPGVCNGCINIAYNTFTDAALFVNKYPGAGVTNNALTLTSILFKPANSGIEIYDSCAYANISHNSVSTVSFNNGETYDDDIQIVNFAGTQCYSFDVKYNTTVGAWSAGIEFVGPHDGGQVAHNDISYAPSAIAHYYNMGQDHMVYDSNTFIHPKNGSGDMFDFRKVDSYTAYWTNNTLTNNVFTLGRPETGGVWLGYGVTTPYFGNSLTGNQFGTSYIQLAGSVTDGGSNYCGGSSNSSLTCH